MNSMTRSGMNRGVDEDGYCPLMVASSMIYVYFADMSPLLAYVSAKVLLTLLYSVMFLTSVSEWVLNWTRRFESKPVFARRGD